MNSSIDKLLGLSSEITKLFKEVMKTKNQSKVDALLKHIDRLTKQVEKI